MKKYLLILTLIVSCFMRFSMGNAGPIISRVKANADTVGQYEKFELDVDLLVASYTNPFEPDDIIMSAKFISPRAKTVWVYGFWDGSDWRVRFSPDEEGIWQYYVRVDDGTGVDSSDVASFTCESSSHHGPLRISQKDPRFLAHDDGTFFYGIGQCRCWWLDLVPNIFDDMQASGMNVLVYWMPSWDNMLVTENSGYDRYEMDRAAEIDWVVEQCEQHDIYLMLTIWNHDELRGEGHQWGVRPYYDLYNPFNRICNADSFFTNATAWKYQENLYRYIIARWAYSRAIGFWQTCSEIDGTTTSVDNDVITDPWHEKINNYFKENDPFGHLTTASKSGDKWWPAGFEVMDVAQMHSYRGHYIDVAFWIAAWTKQMWQEFEKPNVIGEFGSSSLAHQLTHVHNGLWAGLATGDAVSPCDWNDGGSYGDFDAPIYENIKHLADFVSEMKLDELELDQSIISTGSGTRAWGMNGPHYGYFWIQDTSPGDSTKGVNLTLSGLTEGVWDIYWYDTWNGTYLDTSRVSTQNGMITVVIPGFVNDIAGKIKWISALSVLDNSANQVPSEYYLASAYPNPFNPQTVIQFLLPRSQMVELKIHNLQGQLVKTLLAARCSAGIHSVTWDGTDEAGLTVTSGLYFYTIKAGEFVQTNKVMLIR